jgi:hypothetical protein
MFDKARALVELKRIQSQLAKEVIETEAGHGAVRVKINGEQKLQKVTLDPAKIDPGDWPQLERWIESAVAQAIKQSQQAAADKMKAVSGGLGLGL